MSGVAMMVKTLQVVVTVKEADAEVGKANCRSGCT